MDAVKADLQLAGTVVGHGDGMLLAQGQGDFLTGADLGGRPQPQPDKGREGIAAARGQGDGKPLWLPWRSYSFRRGGICCPKAFCGCSVRGSVRGWKVISRRKPSAGVNSG